MPVSTFNEHSLEMAIMELFTQHCLGTIWIKHIINTR